MPARKKRSKAASQREEKKRFDSDIDLCESAYEQKQNSEPFTYAPHSITAELKYRVVSGTLNQGDVRFMYPGIQCTYLSLFALVCAQQKHPSTWSPIDVDSCVISGDKHFLDSFSASNETPHMLLVNELPKSFCVDDEVYKCHHYDDEIQVGLIAQEHHANTNCSSISNCIIDAVKNCFVVSNAGLFVCAGQTISIWKDENEYFMFDPHSRDSNGLQCSGGNSVLVIFYTMEGLLRHLDKLLLESRRVERSSQFELVPLSITRNDRRKGKTTDDCHAEAMQIYLLDQQQRNLEYQKRKSEQARESTVKEQKVKQTFNKATYMKQYMREKRTSKEFIHKENQKEAQRKSERRKDKAHNQNEKEREVQRKAKKRQDLTYKSEENKKEAQRKKKRRKDEGYS